MSIYRQRKKSGFADTKQNPHKNHPANYRKIGNDNIEYVTFTHHDIVDIDGYKYKTIPLSDNIDKNVQRDNKTKNTKDISYVFPKVYVGKRSALGKENNDYGLTKEDYVLINMLFDTLPKEKVSYTSNSFNKKK